MTRPSLISPSETPAALPELRTVACADIAVSPDNTRLFEKKDKDEKLSLDELAASIAALGVQQPPKVRPSESDQGPRWILVYGERRLRAVRDVLKWSHIPVLIDTAISREDSAAATVTENLQRRDLHPMDEAKGLAILRAQGTSIKDVAAQLGRREEWVKERLTLCDLPATVQDLYRHTPRMTLAQALALHDYTHGGRDNKGFPDLITALAQGAKDGTTVAQNGGLSLVALAQSKPELVQTIQHPYAEGGGRWGGHFFDTRATCTRCPFAAYRPGHYEGAGYCLMPLHYRQLQAKGKEAFEARQAEEEKERAAAGPTTGTTVLGSWQPGREKSAAQKGQDTKARHKAQAAAYAPTVQAIEHAIAMIANVDTVDVAVLAAYTLTHHNVDAEAVQQVIKRHGLKSFPGVAMGTVSAEQIERFRQMEPVDIVRYTLEALLLTQARRDRDYDPGRAKGDAVLSLYVPARTPAKEGAIG